MESNKHILTFAEINRDVFDLIRNGEKKVETRAGTVKHQKVKTGDVLIFSCGDDRFEKTVKKVSHFAGIKELLQKYTPEQINLKIHSEQELTEKYYIFPNYKEKITEFGLLAFELE